MTSGQRQNASKIWIAEASRLVDGFLSRMDTYYNFVKTFCKAIETLLGTAGC
jgi:hypothetical protein